MGGECGFWGQLTLQWSLADIVSQTVLTAVIGVFFELGDKKNLFVTVLRITDIM